MATGNFEAFKTSFYCLCGLVTWILDEKLVSSIIILITIVTHLKTVSFKKVSYGGFKLLIVTTIIVILPTTFYIENKRENAYKELSEKKTVWEEKCAYSLKF